MSQQDCLFPQRFLLGLGLLWFESKSHSVVQTGLESSCLCLTCAGIISKRHRVHLIFTFLNLANSPCLIPPIPFLGLMEPVVTGPAYPMYDNKEALLRNA